MSARSLFDDVRALVGEVISRSDAVDRVEALQVRDDGAVLMVTTAAGVRLVVKVAAARTDYPISFERTAVLTALARSTGVPVPEVLAADDSFPGAVLSVVRLDATDDELYHRALARTRGEGPMVAGDDLLGSSAADAEAVIAAAAARQRFEVRPGEIIIDTSDTDAATSLKLVTAAAGW